MLVGVVVICVISKKLGELGSYYSKCGFRIILFYLCLGIRKLFLGLDCIYLICLGKNGGFIFCFFVFRKLVIGYWGFCW